MKLIGCLIALLAASSLAQNPSYEGEWKASWTSRRTGVPGRGDLTIAGDTGSWGYRTYVSSSSGGDPCTRRRQPVVVESATDELLVVRVEPALPGCKTWKWRLHRISADRLVGTFAGAEIEFTRD